jgi:hypothetical protein
MPLRDALVAELQIAVTAFQRNEEGGYLPTHRVRRLASVKPDGAILVPAGLVERVREFLCIHGLSARVADTTVWRAFASVDDSLIADPALSAAGRAFLAVLDGQPRGQVVVPTGARAAELIALLAAWYPAARIAVATATQELQDRLYRHMSSLSDRMVIRDLREIERRAKGVLVATLGHLSSVLATRRSVDIVVLADPTAVVLASVRRYLRHRLRRTLVFAFLADDCWRPQIDDLLLEAACGAVIYREPPAHDRLAAATVLFVDLPHTHVRDHRRLDALERKRMRIWGDPTRNRAIAGLARELAAGDVRRLARRGLLLEDFPSPLPPQPRVAVLVESPTHAAQLSRGLPGWRVVTARPEQRSTIRQTSRQIATFLGAARNGLAADILIRADATATLWDDTWIAPGPPARPTPLLVVDVQDEFDELARRDAVSRRNQYAARAGFRTAGGPRPDGQRPRSMRRSIAEPLPDGRDHSGESRTCSYHARETTPTPQRGKGGRMQRKS